MLRSLHRIGQVTILDGAAVSDAIYIPVGHGVGAIHVATSWSAADLGVQYSPDGGSTFLDVYSGVGTTTSRFRATGIETAAATFVLLPALWAEVGHGTQIKLTSINVASNADLNQTGNIVLNVYVGRVN